MFGLGLPELSVILIIALLIFGPAKLPQIGSALGKSIKEFKGALKSFSEDVEETKKEV